MHQTLPLLILLFLAGGTDEVALPLDEVITSCDRMLDTGDAEAAFATLDRVTEKEKKEARWHMKRGAVLDILRRHDEALVDHRRATQLSPESAEAFTNYGVSLGLSGDSLSAAAVLAQALTLDPNQPEALANLGVTYGLLGRLTEEVETLRHAVEVAPHEAGLRYNYGVALGKFRQVTEEILAYQAALSLRSVFPVARENLAIALLQAGRAEEAIPEFSRLVKDEPTKSDWRYALGLAYARSGDPTRAQECVEELKRIDWSVAEQLAKKLKEMKE